MYILSTQIDTMALMYPDHVQFWVLSTVLLIWLVLNKCLLIVIILIPFSSKLYCLLQRSKAG